ELERQQLEAQITQLKKRSRQIETLADRIKEGQKIAQIIGNIGTQGIDRTISQIPDVLPEEFSKYFISRDFSNVNYEGVPVDISCTRLTSPQQFELLCYFLNQYLEEKLELETNQYRMACK
ncbi:unnamed protein product, partial [marine sediment metagenome]